jgi:hypothetical protein
VWVRVVGKVLLKTITWSVVCGPPIFNIIMAVFGLIDVVVSAAVLKAAANLCGSAVVIRSEKKVLLSPMFSKYNNNKKVYQYHICYLKSISRPLQVFTLNSVGDFPSSTTSITNLYIYFTQCYRNESNQ